MIWYYVQYVVLNRLISLFDFYKFDFVLDTNFSKYK